MANLTERDIGFQNIEFADNDGERVVGVLIGLTSAGHYVVGNPYFDHAWQVPPDLATPTDQPITVRDDD